MKYLYIFFSVVFVLSSCNKDSVLINKKVEISPPQEIDGALVQGVISTIDGEKLKGVSIEIFQDNKNIGRVYSDNEGKYSTQSVTINPNIPVTLKYIKEKYEKKYRRFDFEQTNIHKTLLIMGKAPDSSDVTKEDFVLSDPSDTSLIKLFGYAKLADGTPVSGVRCEMIWKYHEGLIEHDLLYIQGYGTDYTDNNGYFEILVPKGKIYFWAYKVRYPDQAFSKCWVSFSDKDPKGKLSKWSYTDLGEFDEDSRLNLRDDIEFETIHTHIYGNALRCDGSPVVNGTLAASITLNKLFPYNSEKIENYSFGSNGEFSIDLETCPLDDAEYSIMVFVEDTDVNYSGIKFIEFAENVDIGQVDLCFDNNDYPEDFEVTIESVTRQYPLGGDNPMSGLDKLQTGFDYYDGDFNESVYLATNSVELGEVPITRFEMWKGTKEGNVVHGYETTFNAKPEDVTMTITKIEGHYVYGNVVGEVDTPRGKQDVSCTFKIYNK